MGLLNALILGIIQGLTEFLPVSSSGHLVLGQELLAMNFEGIAFEVFVHFGTLLSVVVIYRKDILALLRSLAAGLARVGRLQEIYRMDRDFRMVVFILAGSVPAGVIGLLYQDTIEQAFDNVRLVAGMLMITGLILLLTRFVRPPEKEMTFIHAILVGLAQAAAILPGISRSGSTISVALFLGIPREEAARYSFLLAIPVILGATLLKLVELVNNMPPAAEAAGLAMGTVVAFISGYAAIRLLLMFIRRGKLDYFAWYCFAAGIAGLIYFN